MSQYNLISQSFAHVAIFDPIKLYSHYPTMLQLLGNLAGKRILDIGCGGGHFSRIIAAAGARVVGYDVSEEQIATAKRAEAEKCLGILYEVATPKTFTNAELFDNIFSLLVIMHAENFEELVEFFQSAHKHLADGGKFVCMVDNIEYKRCNIPLYRRVRTILPNNKMGLVFLGQNGETITSITLNRFLPADYERAAAAAGFTGRTTWHPLIITKEGQEKMGNEFWKGFLGEDCPYRLFSLEKG